MCPDFTELTRNFIKTTIVSSYKYKNHNKVTVIINKLFYTLITDPDQLFRKILLSSLMFRKLLSPEVRDEASQKDLCLPIQYKIK